jgi:hypothetical protein
VGTAEGFVTQQSLELALALEVGKAESHLPGLPHARHGQEAFPIINLMWEVLSCQDSCRCHHDKSNVGNRHAGLFGLFGGILHHDNELGDTICLHVVLHHVHAKQDHVEGMKPSAVGVKDIRSSTMSLTTLILCQIVLKFMIEGLSARFLPQEGKFSSGKRLLQLNIT